MYSDTTLRCLCQLWAPALYKTPTVINRTINLENACKLHQPSQNFTGQLCKTVNWCTGPASMHFIAQRLALERQRLCYDLKNSCNITINLLQIILSTTPFHHRIKQDSRPSSQWRWHGYESGGENGKIWEGPLLELNRTCSELLLVAMFASQQLHISVVLQQTISQNLQSQQLRQVRLHLSGLLQRGGAVSINDKLALLMTRITSQPVHTTDWYESM